MPVAGTFSDKTLVGAYYLISLDRPSGPPGSTGLNVLDAISGT